MGLALFGFSRAKRLERAIDRSNGVIEFSTDGTIRCANDNFLSVMGYKRREIVGRHHSMFLPPEEASSPDYAAFWRDLAAGEFKSSVFRRIAKDGSDVWIRATYNPVFDWFGRVSGVVKFATDITERQRENARNASTIAAIERSQAVIEFALDGTVIRANDAFLKALGGYDLSDIQGQHHAMFVHPDEAESAEYTQFWDDLRRGVFSSGEFRRIGKDGREVWIQATYNPILDAGGRPVSVVKFASDITEVVLARHEHERQALISTHSDVSVIVLDKEGRIDYANAGFTRLTGYELSDIRGKMPEDLLGGPNTDAAAVARLRRHIAENTAANEDILHYGKDGSPHWVNVSANPVRCEEGGPAGHVLVQTAITQTKLTALEYDAVISAIGTVNAVVTWDGEGFFKEANHRLGAAGGLAAPLDEVLDEEVLRRVKGGDAVRQEIRWPHTTGEDVWFDAVFTTSRDTHGRIGKIMMFGNETTARRRTVDQSMHSLDGVVEASDAIDNGVKSLFELAQRSDLLAINASIEAAHAGKAGVGFGIVAGRVRDLADRSIIVARGIADLAESSRNHVGDLSQKLTQLTEFDAAETASGGTVSQSSAQGPSVVSADCDDVGDGGGRVTA